MSDVEVRFSKREEVYTGGIKKIHVDRKFLASLMKYESGQAKLSGERPGQICKMVSPKTGKAFLSPDELAILEATSFARRNLNQTRED